MSPGLLAVEVLGHLAEDAVEHERAHLLVGHARRELLLRRLGDRLYERGGVDGGGIDLHRSARHPLEHVGVDVEVRVHGADVVVLLERVDQAHQLRDLLLGTSTVLFGCIASSADSSSTPGLLERLRARRRGPRAR